MPSSLHVATLPGAAALWKAGLCWDSDKVLVGSNSMSQESPVDDFRKGLKSRAFGVAFPQGSPAVAPVKISPRRGITTAAGSSQP